MASVLSETREVQKAKRSRSEKSSDQPERTSRQFGPLWTPSTSPCGSALRPWLAPYWALIAIFTASQRACATL
jgi:hypothetical protein